MTTIINADCLNALREMPDNSVDAICTDPPYGLSNTSPDKVTETIIRWASGDREYVPQGKGFMGAAWDGFVPPPAVWDECFRVLKPGGHMAVFAGTRTMDLMTLGVRLAGFDIRDSLAWLYGCLDDKSEILTDEGWKLGVDLDGTETVAQWDHNTGSITLTPAEKVHHYPFKGDMVRFLSSDTDQMLTPNHRVYSQTWDRVQVDGVRTGKFSGWKVEEAGTINRYQRRRFPVAGLHDGPGIGGEDYAALLGWVFTEGGFDKNGTGVRIYQSNANPDDVTAIGALMNRMGDHKRYERTRVYTYKGNSRDYTEHTWFFSGDLANKVRADLPGKHPTHELLWAMTSGEKEAFYNAATRGDGSGNTFFQKDPDDTEWFADLCTLTGRRATPGYRKPPREGGAVYVDLKDDTELTRRNLVSPATEYYEGTVWCVTVPTGAFVARRNGRVFITGNSGFPKSQNVSKMIDKDANARALFEPIRDHIRHWRDERGLSNTDLNEAVGSKTNGCGMARHWTSAEGGQHAIPSKAQWENLKRVLSWPDCELDDLYDSVKDGAERPVIGQHKSGLKTGVSGVGGGGAGGAITASATDEAKKWEGWGTALKPAFEPIILARKPIRGTVAANVVEWGTGAINVDACRIETADNIGRPTGSTALGIMNDDGWKPKQLVTESHAQGRFPANVVLDRETAGLLDQQSGNTGGGKRVEGVARVRNNGIGLGTTERRAGVANSPDNYGDVGGASRFFHVADNLDDLDAPFKYCAKAPKKERPAYTDEDGNTVQHSTVKPVTLMRWLVKLITPPGGVVLDPFAGSGTTVEAAILEGFNPIGIEAHTPYIPLIEQRVQRAEAGQAALNIA